MGLIANITNFSVVTPTEEITASNAFAQTAGDLPAGTEIIRVTNSGSINTAYCSASGQPYVYGHTSTPADADQLIRATILRRSSTNDADQQMSLVARARASGGTTYGIRGCYNWDGTTAIVFLSYADSGTGGSWTTIGSSATVTRLGADSESDLELQVYGTSPNITVKLLWGGVEQISTTSFSSSDLSTNAGKVGLHVRRFAASTESTGLHFKTFYAEDGYTGAGPTFKAAWLPRNQSSIGSR